MVADVIIVFVTVIVFVTIIGSVRHILPIGKSDTSPVTRSGLRTLKTASSQRDQRSPSLHHGFLLFFL